MGLISWPYRIGVQPFDAKIEEQRSFTSDFQALRFAFHVRRMNIWRYLDRPQLEAIEIRSYPVTHCEGIDEPLLRHRVETIGTSTVIAKPDVMARTKRERINQKVCQKPKEAFPAYYFDHVISLPQAIDTLWSSHPEWGRSWCGSISASSGMTSASGWTGFSFSAALLDAKRDDCAYLVDIERYRFIGSSDHMVQAPKVA